ncbi:MAG: hypothetical protein CMQ29_13065 [Gammaproteobacteria bacterium]|nr:hypothetical protein [Gammaproteobacteria bacterium]
MRRVFITALFCLAIVTTLSACGQKGPLILPGEQETPAS